MRSLRRRSLQLHLHAAHRGAGRTALPEVLPWTGPRAAATAWTPPATSAAMQVGLLGCVSLHLGPGWTVLPAVLPWTSLRAPAAVVGTSSHLVGNAVGLQDRVRVHAGLKWTALQAVLFVSLPLRVPPWARPGLQRKAPCCFLCADAAWTAVEALLYSGDYASEEFAGGVRPEKARSIPGNCSTGRAWLAGCMLLPVVLGGLHVRA